MSKLKENILNIIGVVGTIATLFFGIYGLLFIPEYAQNAYKERQETANYEVINDLKEVFYSNQEFDSLIVPTLKKGKEIKFDIIIPITDIEILVEVQEDFLSDKFLPLDQRLLLYKRIDDLKKIMPEGEIIRTITEKKDLTLGNLTYIISIISILISGLLLFSLITRRKQQINAELEKKFEEIEETRPETVLKNRSFEVMVGTALKQSSLNTKDFTNNPKDFPFDFSINYDDKVFGVEVISKITSKNLQMIKQKFDSSVVYALILITNRVVEDFSSFQLLSNLRNKGIAGRRVYFISAMDVETIQSEVMKILHTENK